MQQFHTVIVGAGPGGLACATLLARAGKEVLVLERNNAIGPKVCAGGIPCGGTPEGLPASLFERTFTTQHIFSNWQRTVLREERPMIRTVDRGRLGRWMMEQALEAGVTIRTGILATTIGDNTVRAKDEEFGFRYLVGADGSSSLVRRSLGLDSLRIGVGINYMVPGDFPRMEWHLDTDLFGNGYAWIFPHRDSASIGVYASRGNIRPALLLGSLHSWAERRGVELKSRQPHAALINFDYRGWRFGNRFLVGDAAGLASGLTGEGIHSALVSGMEVARTILNERHQPESLAKLIRRHRQHALVLRLASGGGLRCKLLLETLVLALRAKLIQASSLEMGPGRAGQGVCA
ncbi:MAG: NAD(P)/FAD-dependent oxidoreductase [Thermodesulfobacteriota bacterium]